MLAHGMEAEMDQLNELGKDEELTSPGKMAEYISNQYIQDLYRFYKLFPKRADFEDVFSWSFDFYNKKEIGNILKEDPKILRNIAEYYFAKGHYDDAASVYRILIRDEDSGELYQKAAYCFQKSGNFKKALKFYLKAELYGVTNLWNLKKIAFCYRSLKEPAKALEYYRQAEILDPENLNIQLSIANCLLELEQFSEALKCYFKIEYLSPGNKNVRRPIAWCSFVTGKCEQAKNYYNLLVEDDPTKYDLMNLGHVEWSLGNRRAALENYKKSILETGLSQKEFFDVFEEDKQHLAAQGVEEADIPIMLDLLRYSIEQ
jgi:tetratricopeptide (TPR) repeat protein